jgi:hypothetical protein
VVFLDFRAKSDPPVAVRLIPHMDDASGAMRLLGFAPSHFRGHAQRAIDGHTNLKRRRGREVKSASRNIQGFREMLALVGS